MPYQIFSGLWAVPPVDRTAPADGEGDGGLGNSIGDVLVTCSFCGTIIEGDGIYNKTPRMHSLDTPNVDYCCSCYETLTNKVSPAQLGPQMAAHLHLGDAMARETALIYWMQDMVKQADPAKDTPASFISGAFKAYGPRLALGFADPAQLPVRRAFGPQASPLCAAAGLALKSHDKFLWLVGWLIWGGGGGGWGC